jgi:two-component sensor histidine kinase
MDRLLSRPLLGFLRDPEGLRKLVGYAAGSVAVAVVVLNVLTLIRLGEARLWAIAIHPAVLVLSISGALAFASALLKSRISEWIQVLFFFFTAFISAGEARPGDLTSALILIFGLILAVEYDFGRKSLVACALFAFLGYPLILARSYGTISPAYLSQTATSILGLFIFVVLYGGVALRHRVRHKDEAEHLEAKVKERTVELQALLSEREAMLNEIHHRVKNNLQLVASLLRLGTDGKADADLRGSLEAGVRRIDAMALVHDSLYDTDRLDIVDLGNYSRRLLEAISEESAFRFDFTEKGVIQGRLDVAVPFGLLLHELATNAQRHAFPEGGGSASILLASRGTSVELCVSDEGVGMDEAGGKTGSGAVGLELVRALVSQLHGKLERLPVKGTSWRITFSFDEFNRASGA